MWAFSGVATPEPVTWQAVVALRARNGGEGGAGLRETNWCAKTRRATRSMRLTIPLGQRQTVTIGVTTPTTGSTAVLVWQSSKDGRVIFRDDGQLFRLP